MVLKYEEPKYAKTADTAPHFGTAASAASRVDPLHLFARSIQWRQACHDDALRDVPRYNVDRSNNQMHCEVTFEKVRIRKH
ncbi:MAG: hypothetical protein JWN74_2652 [Acidobacteriaceae bacterium]|jgi:hypothetical protein|nr:hypothetical protein [Acidobacteriaceae bacterium]